MADRNTTLGPEFLWQVAPSDSLGRRVNVAQLVSNIDEPVRKCSDRLSNDFELRGHAPWSPTHTGSE